MDFFIDFFYHLNNPLSFSIMYFKKIYFVKSARNEKFISTPYTVQ